MFELIVGLLIGYEFALGNWWLVVLLSSLVFVYERMMSVPASQ